MTSEVTEETVVAVKDEAILIEESSSNNNIKTQETAELTPADAIVAIGNDILANGNGLQSGSATPSDVGEEKFSFHSGEDNDDEFQDAMDDLPLTRKLHQRLSSYSPKVRETEEWEQIMQDWERVMAEKRIQDAKLNLVEQENKRMKSQLTESEANRAELEKESQERIQQLEKEVKELTLKAKDPAKEMKALKNQLEESEAEKELFKLMLEETEGEKKRLELKLVQAEREKHTWTQKHDKVKELKNRLRLKSAQFSLLSTSTSTLLTEGLDGARPDKERKRLIDQVTTLESDRSRLAAMVKDTMNSTGDNSSDSSTIDASNLSNQELVSENKRLNNEFQMAKVEYSLLQRRSEALEVTLHDVRVAMANSESHAESLEAKKYELQDKLAAAEGSLDRARIESTKYQALHKELLEKNDKLDRELQVVKARFEAKDRVLITTQKQLTAAKADGGLLKTIRRELESVLFDYNTVVQHFMDIQVQAMGAKALANALKRQVVDLQAQLNHYRTMLLGIKSFNNNDPIKSPTVTTLRSEFRILMEKIQEEQNNQLEKERNDKFKAQDWNRKLRMEKDFMKLELQNQIEKWRRVSIYWEDKWRKTANDLHEAVTTGVNSDLLYEAASNNTLNITPTGSNPSSNRSSLAVTTASTGAATQSQDQPLTPSAMKQHILDNRVRSGSTNTPAPSTAPSASSSNSAAAAATSTSITESLTDLVKPFLSLTQSGGSAGSGRGPSSPSSRLSAAATLRTPIAAGLPANVTGTGAMGGTAVSKASLRSKNMAASAIGTARNQALRAGLPDAVVTLASREAQTRANSSISTVSRSVDQALSDADQLKADVRRMLNR
ncbi:hypothetical protein BGZ80_011687 [Entomortierella chlamydospora]|uniref:Uncharacterized protein n=1 Tax=Entomortierella chlamydospora TaxID=101097 RepID=A0A9P6SZ32_9FUNG|nr:hypothetical protein BGZ79_000108 [Entomortierella chlamydospora]KAG0012517.1 hypothetical protein BGZ80_011687 [Entomortierella chlamydospora]